MKTLVFTLLTCLAALPVFAQGTGFNGTNWFDVQTTQDVAWLKEMLPEGTGFTLRYRADKFTAAGPTSTELDKVIALHNELAAVGKPLKVIYTAAMDATPAVNLAGIQTLVNAGMNVIAIEAGNEEYTQNKFNFNFEAYRAAFEPIFVAVNNAYPTMPFSIFLAPRPRDSDDDGVPNSPGDIMGGRNDHKTINNAAIAFLNGAHPNYAVSVHFYFNENEVPVAANPVSGIAFNPANSYPTLESYFDQLYHQAAASNLWSASISYLDRKISPTRKIYLTEFGHSNAGALKNTLGYSMTMWRVWNQYRGRFEQTLMHNGISPSGTGFIFPYSAGKDVNQGTTNMRRLDYWLYSMLTRVPLNTPELPAALQLGTPNQTTMYWFTNDGEAYTPNVSFSGCDLQSVTITYVKGEHWYSSSGVTEWMNSGTVPNHEITGTQTITGATVPQIPRRSFGYVTVQTKPLDVQFTALTPSGNDLILSWQGTGTLQTANTPSGPWTDLPGATSPATQSMLTSGPFFRVRK